MNERKKAASLWAKAIISEIEYGKKMEKATKALLDSFPKKNGVIQIPIR